MTVQNFVKWGKKIDTFPFVHERWTKEQREVYNDVLFYIDNIGLEKLKDIAIEHKRAGALQWRWLHSTRPKLHQLVQRWLKEEIRMRLPKVSMHDMKGLRYDKRTKTFIHPKFKNFLLLFEIFGGWTKEEWPKSFILTHKSGKDIEFYMRQYDVEKTSGYENERPGRFVVYEGPGKVFFVVTIKEGQYQYYGKHKSDTYGGYGAQRIVWTPLRWEDYDK